jgi:TetR/AcrR family transcriptional regulator, tetracycline repressor protein
LDEQVRGLLTSLLTVLRAHPAATQLLARSEKLHSDAARDAMEVTLEILRTAGFGPVDVSMIASSALWTGLTLVMSEPGIESIDGAKRAGLQRRKQVTLATLPPAKYPRLVECAIPMTACDDPEPHYKFGWRCSWRAWRRSPRPGRRSRPADRLSRPGSSLLPAARPGSALGW